MGSTIYDGMRQVPGWVKTYLSHITNGDSGYSKDGTFLLNGTTVGKDTPRVTFQDDEVEETERWQKADLVVVWIEAKRLHSCSGVRVRADDDWDIVLPLQLVQRARFLSFRLTTVASAGRGDEYFFLSIEAITAPFSGFRFARSTH